ncbi:MAG: 3-hydroxyacyl-CoA dehydrogenase/enoyl-CoA hydratase family protein [Myxococcales bacterium]|nr:3-hydroxyacyl-CoA dehydrogenase/enoyl-CoA hydratase family protein [Myxococcales bacterium]
MARTIRRAAVLGAGVMGSGIAAHLAGVGIDTVLLDIVPPDLEGKQRDNKRERDRFARTAIEKAKKAKPPVFYSKEDAQLITTGNLDDDLALLERCDWIVEAVTERMAIKRSLFEKVDRVRKQGCIVTSNTSGLEIAGMVEGRSEDFRKNFFVTHFFNPVRFMKLLELVPGSDTDPEAFDFMARFGGDVLGKGIVFGKDTPNFVANRIGTYGMLYILHAMRGGENEPFSVEEIDSVFGAPTGRPKSAVFRTADIVGLDTLLHVADNCYDSLVNDECRETFKAPKWLREMVEQKKWLGSKSGQGFYKKIGKDIHALDLGSWQYKPKESVRIGSVGAVRKIEDPRARLKAMLAQDDRHAQLAWDVTAHTLTYSARRMGEIADDIVNIDNALKWGFQWDLGPFETWDAIGVRESVERMDKDGIEVPANVRAMLDSGRSSFYGGSEAKPTYYDFSSSSEKAVPLDERAVRIAALKQGEKVLYKNAGATLYDMDDGVILAEFHTKLNAVDSDIIGALNKAIDMAEGEGWNGIVIGNEDARSFSAGANLFGIVMAINQKQWDQLEQEITRFQQTTLRLRYSGVPVVAAPAGLALGGGAEITMGADAVRAHAETYMGLVEVGVGLIPGGGGNAQMLERVLAGVPDDPNFNTLPLIQRAFMNIGMAKVAVGAEDARELGMLRPHDGVTLNRDLLLHDAKATVLGMARAGYRKPRPVRFRLPGISASTTIRWFVDNMRQGGQVSDHDALIAGKLAHVLCGGDTSPRVKVTQQQLLDLEREAFLSLCGEEKTKARIEHMLMKNKPLRN